MAETATNGTVVAVARDQGHAFSKPTGPTIRLLAGLGVEGDAHCGETVKHRSRVARDPTQPNLRQVHLIGAELLEELRTKGFDLAAGALGENILTRGLDLIALPVGTRLHIGREAVIAVTGLRNPCAQIEQYRTGLLTHVLVHRPGEGVLRRAGIMAVVLTGGDVSPGDTIAATLPEGPHRPLEVV